MPSVLHALFWNVPENFVLVIFFLNDNYEYSQICTFSFPRFMSCLVLIIGTSSSLLLIIINYICQFVVNMGFCHVVRWILYSSYPYNIIYNPSLYATLLSLIYIYIYQ